MAWKMAHTKKSELKKKKYVFIFVALIMFIVVFSLVFFGLTTLKNDLRADLYYYTRSLGFDAKQREGMIYIRGWIYNFGSEDLNVTVHLRVSDGTKSGGGIGSSQSEFWQSYYVPIGVIPKNGGCKWFEWESRYNPFDPTTVQFTYELIPRRLVRGAP
ncbi:hypothetical protein KEJ21_06975 [Candidatus Bathyarchaeota archaeon]|nr:hypothetical protein [Candidatus Bathyarchaeota archaeon]MBS7631264.1 hypothetical protein [Candidatus Bathyarchaeota archaeon]